MMRAKDVINENDIVTLLSLREIYFNAILNQEKKYEYRKRYRKETTKAYIYISKTKKSVLGMIEFGKPIVDSSDKIAALSESENPGSYADMKRYLGENTVGYAIPIKKVYLLKGLSLYDLQKQFPNFRAPQSYQVLHADHPLREALDHFEIRKHFLLGG